MRKRVVRARFRDACRFVLWLFSVGLPALLPASGTVTIIFHPNYHLEDIQTEIDNVASDGLHPAVFKVQVRDHRDIAIPDVEVDWSVSSDKVEVSAGNTDPQGYSWALLRSGREGTFDVTASWHNELGMFSEKTSSVTFKKSASLFFTNKTVSMKFGAGTADVQSFSGGNGGEITYSSSCPEVADFNESDPQKLTLKKVGVTMITATEAGSEQFSEQSASYGLKVEKAIGDPPTFTNPLKEISVKFDDTQPLTNLATAKHGSPIAYTSDREDVAKVEDGGEVKWAAVGTARITATEIADNYEPASSSYLLKVTPGEGSNIMFNKHDLSIKQNESSFQVEATGGNGGPISYESDRNGVAAVKTENNIGFVTLKSPGVAKITAREHSDNYKEQTDELTLTVNPFVPLTVDCPDRSTIGFVSVKCQGEANKEFSLYKDNDKNNAIKKTADPSGVADFALEITRPNNTVTIKCEQGGMTAEKDLEVTGYVDSVKHTVVDFSGTEKLVLKVEAPFRAQTNANEYPCYSGWTKNNQSCSTYVFMKKGRYNDLKITADYDEEFSNMKHVDKEIYEVSCSLAIETGKQSTCKVKNERRQGFDELDQKPQCAHTVEVKDEKHTDEYRVLVSIDANSMGEKSWSVAQGKAPYRACCFFYDFDSDEGKLNKDYFLSRYPVMGRIYDDKSVTVKFPFVEWKAQPDPDSS